jgi:hypothetical protein
VSRGSAGSGRGRLGAGLRCGAWWGLVLLLFCPAAQGQEVGAARDGALPYAGADNDLPRAVLDALSTVQDFALHFDQPAFYVLLRHVRAGEGVAELVSQPVSDWRVLLERPAQFRGRLVQVQGVVGRNASWTLRDPQAGELSVTQIELSRADQPLACTLILTAPGDDIPLGAEITVSGFFLMIRQYYAASQRLRQAAVIVGRGPTRVSVGGATKAQPADLHRSWQWMLAAAVLGLLAAWWFLRRMTARPLTGRGALHATTRPPLNLAEDLARWAPREPPPDLSALLADETGAPPPNERPTGAPL